MENYSNAVGTKDWLTALKVKGIQLRAYVDEREGQETATAPERREALFGTHIREAIEVIKNLRR
jgi:hypothetical protein